MIKMKQKQIQQIEREEQKIFAMKFATFFFSILLCMMSFTSASMTVQELISSYSFDYYGEQIDITSISDSLSSNTLSFSVSVANASGGSYTSYIDLEDVGGVVSGSSVDSLGSGGGSVRINIPVSSLSGKSQFNYSLRVLNDKGDLVYRKDDFVTGVYSYDVGYSVLGFEDYVLGNSVWLNVSVDSKVVGREDVFVYLECSDELSFVEAESDFGLGVNVVRFEISDFIVESRCVGEFDVVGILIGERFVEVDYATGIYDYRDYAKGSYLSGYDFRFIDLDSDNLVDYLEFEFKVYAISSGNYRVEADVYDSDGRYLWSLSESVVFLQTGDWEILIRVNGSLVYSMGANGPYTIGAVRLIKDDVEVDVDYDGYTSNDFSVYDFERGMFSDLIVEMEVKDGFVNVSVENIGREIAFGFWVEVFDDRDFLKRDYIYSLNAGEKYISSFVYNGNFDLLMGVVDMENFIEEENESNNFVTWRPCVEKVVNSSWSDWAKGGECLVNGTVLQSRFLTEYDSGFCGDFENVTYFEYGEEACDYWGELKKHDKGRQGSKGIDEVVYQDDFVEGYGAYSDIQGAYLKEYSASGWKGNMSWIIFGLIGLIGILVLIVGIFVVFD